MTYDVVRPRGLPITRRGWGWLSATARLAPGVTVAEAQSAVDRVTEDLTAAFPRENAGLKFSLVPAAALPEEMGPAVRRVLLFALAVAALALVAACANIANAQLATVFDRTREIAIRRAMGATRARIARQWLTESLVLTTAAAVAGTLGAMWLQDAALMVGRPVDLANFSPARATDLRLVLFAAGIVGMVTVLFGGLPALRAATADVAEPLKADGATTTPAARRTWAQAALVIAQVGVSVALVATSLLVRGASRPPARSTWGSMPRTSSSPRPTWPTSASMRRGAAPITGRRWSASAACLGCVGWPWPRSCRSWSATRPSRFESTDTSRPMAAGGSW